MTEYFNSRTWGALGLDLTQIRYLDDITKKLNLIEDEATADQTPAEIQADAMPAVMTMQFLLMGA